MLTYPGVNLIAMHGAGGGGGVGGMGGGGWGRAGVVVRWGRG